MEGWACTTECKGRRHVDVGSSCFFVRRRACRRRRDLPRREWPAELVLSLGASGGPKIITAVLQTIINYAIVGMPLFDSVSAPRIHDQLLYHRSAGTNVEQSALPQGPDIVLSNRTCATLERRGHYLIETDYLGAVQAVGVDLETGSLTAVSDIRKQGMPAGY